MLNLSGKTETKYIYVRTEKELINFVVDFYECNNRYLHLSCYANSSSMSTTFDNISFEKLSKILNPCIDKRRIFVSACEMANEKLAKLILPYTQCYSLIGPANDINMDDAAAF